MDAAAVLEVVERLEAADCRCWVAGGWGVDALVGEQTREHRDLDLAIDARCEAAALVALNALGYTIETDWRPARVELAAPLARWVDLHPVHFDVVGAGRQAGLDGGFFEYPRGCFATGRIGERAVACLSVDQQLLFREGYALRGADRHDIALLQRLKERWRREGGLRGAAQATDEVPDGRVSSSLAACPAFRPEDTSEASPQAEVRSPCHSFGGPPRARLRRVHSR